MMSVHRYLDLSTSHLTEAEMVELSSAYSFGDLDSSPRVIPHEYGAWVNVPAIDEDTDLKAHAALAVDRPNLAACIAKARELECNWINFDADAEKDAALPTFEW
jgi:hypothetical protein